MQSLKRADNFNSSRENTEENNCSEIAQACGQGMKTEFTTLTEKLNIKFIVGLCVNIGNSFGNPTCQFCLGPDFDCGGIRAKKLLAA